jgi:hypothetical protein
LLAFVLFALVAVAGGLGFVVALAPGYNKAWAPLVIAVFILYMPFAFWRYVKKSERKDALEEQAAGEAFSKAVYDQARFYSNPAPAYPGVPGAYEMHPVGSAPSTHAAGPNDSYYGQVAVPGRY